MRATAVLALTGVGLGLLGIYFNATLDESKTVPEWWSWLGLAGGVFTALGLVIVVPRDWWRALLLFATKLQPISMWLASPGWKKHIEGRLSAVESATSLGDNQTLADWQTQILDEVTYLRKEVRRLESSLGTFQDSEKRIQSALARFNEWRAKNLPEQ